jgi:hypothetical protein
MLQIATRSPSSLSIVSMSRMRGAYVRATVLALHPSAHGLLYVVRFRIAADQMVPPAGFEPDEYLRRG